MNIKQKDNNNQLPNGKPSTQFNRVVYIASRGGWMSLRDMELAINRQFSRFDTQAAISARLREVSPVRDGLIKRVDVRVSSRTGRRCWFYRLEAVES